MDKSITAEPDFEEEVEIEDDGLEAARASIDQAPEEESRAGDQKAERPESVIDTLVPQTDPVEWTLTDPENPEIHRTYWQKPLTYFGKMSFFSLVGEVIDKAVSGEEGLQIGSFFGAPDLRNPSALTLGDFRDAEMFIQAVGKLLTYAPDFLQKSYCIWFNVPEHERGWAISVMEETFTDEQGLHAIEVFIDQNWDALNSFFREKIGTLRDRVRSHQEASRGSQPSKPSNATPPPTPST